MTLSYNIIKSLENPGSTLQKTEVVEFCKWQKKRKDGSKSDDFRSKSIVSMQTKI